MHVQTRQQPNQHIQSINQAVLTMQKMSDDKQRKVFDYIELLVLQDKDNSVNKVTTKPKNQDKQTSKVDLQQRFLAWRKEYEQTMAELDDGWTDDDHNAIWDNVRDKNDFGREVTFDE